MPSAPQTYLTVSLLFLLSMPLWSTSIFDLLDPSEGSQPLAATLSYPVDSLHRGNLTQQKANFSFTDPAGNVQSWDVKVRVRGKSRLQSCDSPPLKLNFSKKDLSAANLLEFDKYKIVVPCLEGPEAEAAVLREYLAYRAYNLVSPLSYRVKLLRLTRRDENGNHRPRVGLAFILESTDQLVARTNTEELNKTVPVPHRQYRLEQQTFHEHQEVETGERSNSASWL